MRSLPIGYDPTVQQLKSWAVQISKLHSDGQIIEQRIHTYPFDDENVPSFGLDECIVYKSSLQSTRRFTSSEKMREALKLLQSRNVNFEVDGEMHVGAALDPTQRNKAYAYSTLSGPANLLIMPNADAAHISLNFLREMGDGVSVGPLLIGAAKPVHIASQSVTVRGLLNLTALAAVEAMSN